MKNNKIEKPVIDFIDWVRSLPQETTNRIVAELKDQGEAAGLLADMILGDGQPNHFPMCMLEDGFVARTMKHRVLKAADLLTTMGVQVPEGILSAVTV